jgi:hypothetical protein
MGLAEWHRHHSGGRIADNGISSRLYKLDSRRYPTLEADVDELART